MALLDDIKARLRITTDDLDIASEVQDLIDAARSDLILSGVASVKVSDDTDPLIKRAITTYCKANFGYDNPDADRFAESYSMLKNHLSLALDYCAYTVTITVTSGGVPVDGAEITWGEVIKTTNSLGVVVFTGGSVGYDFDYTVIADGYQTVEGSVYIDGNKSVEVELSEA